MKTCKISMDFKLWLNIIIISAFFGLREDLLSEIMNPALLKMRSLGTEVEGINNLFLATSARCGYLVPFLLHHSISYVESVLKLMD